MSGNKVIFTYKRKRLSSCSTRAHVDVYSDLFDEAKGSKHPDLSKQCTLENNKRDAGDLRCSICGHLGNLVNCKSCFQFYHPQCMQAWSKHVCCAKQLFPLSCQNARPILQAEKHADTSTSKMTLGTDVLPGIEASQSNISEILDEVVSSSVPLGKDKSCILKDGSSSSPESNLFNCQKQFEDSLGSPLIDRGKSKLSCCDNSMKAKRTSPLITFSRRLKRKVDGEKTDLLSKLLSDRDTVESKNCNVSPCHTTCNTGITANPFTNQKPGSDVTDARDMPNITHGRVVSGELDEHSHPSETCLATALKCVGQTAQVEDLDLVISSSDERVSPKIVEPNASMPSEEAGKRSPLQDSVRCPPSDPTKVSSCNDNSKTYLGPAAGGILPITSSYGSNSKDLPTVKEEQADVYVTDCNVALEPDFQKQAAVEVVGNPQHSDLTISNNIVMHDVCKRGDLCTTAAQRIGLTQRCGKSHLLNNASTSIGIDCNRLNCGSESAHLPNTVTVPKIRYLQLFSEDSSLGCLPRSQLETIGSSWERGRTIALGAEKNWPDQSSMKLPLTLGLSPLPFGNRSSNHSSTARPFTSLNIRTGDLFHSIEGHSLPDHRTSILRHKMLLDSRSSAMMGRGRSMDMFELCPNVWTEDELDFLWIGVRRYGRGNWDVMIQDPKLHFNPLRMPRDLAEQWELEQYKLLNDSTTTSHGRYMKLPLSYSYPDCTDPFFLRDCTMAETQLSLGDMYHQKGAGLCKLGQTSTRRRHSDTNMDVTLKKPMPHWLQSTASRSALLATSISPVGTSSRVQNFPEMADELQPTSRANHGRLLVRDGGMNLCLGNKFKDLIHIESDASSEETISDEHNARP